MKRAFGIAAVALGLAVAVFATGALAAFEPDRPAPPRTAAGTAPRGDISSLQRRLREIPNDDRAWAALGLAYLEKSRSTGNAALYGKAEGALERSLKIDEADNFLAAAGMGALANARHDFAEARRWATRGLTINPASAILYGTLADAETQLGRYPEAFEATQKMVDLVPDTASLARASYSWELRGDLEQARALMQRALEDAATPDQRASTRSYLGDLALTSGDADAATRQYDAGLREAPRHAALLYGRARAALADSRPADAERDLARAVALLPLPGSVLLHGELLESLGRTDEAKAQYALFRVEQRLLEANGAIVDVEAAQFEADHGDASRAVAVAEAGLQSRPFIDMQDAMAWALHRAGRNEEARAASERSRSLGTRSPLFEFHAGMIEAALGNVDAARSHLTAALAMNSGFHPLHAPTARTTLAGLTPS